MLALRSHMLLHFAVRRPFTCVSRFLVTHSESSNRRSNGRAVPLASWNLPSQGVTPPKSPQGTALMEPTALCKSIVQAAKSSKLSGKEWKAYIRRAVELSNRLTLKHIAIIVHSCSNSKLDSASMHTLLDGLAGTIVECLSKRDYATQSEHDSPLYKIYSILHGMKESQYRNQEILQLLKNATFEQITQINNQGHAGQLPPFLFDDLAGIIHSMCHLQADIPENEIEAFANTFISLYMMHSKGVITHRAFSIIFNTLERMSCHSTQLYRIAYEYMHKNINYISSMQDIAMIYCSLVKMKVAIDLEHAGNIRGQSATGAESMAPQACCSTDIMMTAASPSVISSVTSDIPSYGGSCFPTVDINICDMTILTEMVINKLLEPGIFTSTSEHLTKGLSNILSHSYQYVEKCDGDLKARYGILLERAITQVSQTNDVDCISLIHLMKYAIKLKKFDCAMLMLVSRKMNTAGMIAGPLEFAQHLKNIKMLSTSCPSDALNFQLHSMAIDNILHFDRRMAMPKVTPNVKPQRKRTLKDLIEAAARGSCREESLFISNDLYDYFHGPHAFSYCARTMAALSEFAVHKPALDLAQRMRTVMVNICQGTPHLEIESVASGLTALCRFRMKDDVLLHTLTSHVIRSISNNTEPCLLVQLLLSFARLGFPRNRSITRECITSFGVRGKTRSIKWKRKYSLYEKMSNRILLLLTEENMMKKLNIQATVNTVFAVTLSGMAERVPSVLCKLLKHLRRLSRNTIACVKRDKQLLTSLFVLEHVFRRGNRMVIKELERVKWLARKGKRKESDSVQAASITLSPVKDSSTLSGFHRDVWKKVSGSYNAFRSEVACKGGLYYTDIVVKKGPSKIHIEVDGPTHFYHATHEPTMISKLKHAVLKSQGYRIVHFPYYGWEKNMALIKL